MIYNRKISQLKPLSDSEKIYAEMLFDVYVLKKWHYAGGNYGHHLKFFEIISKYDNNIYNFKEDTTCCYICQSHLHSRHVYYIKNYKNNKIQIIGKCCYWRYDSNKISPILLLHTKKCKQKTD